MTSFIFALTVSALTISMAYGADDLYQSVNGYCSQTPTIYPFPGDSELDGFFTLIRFTGIDHASSTEGPPSCASLIIRSVDSDPESGAKKEIVSTRNHPFTPGQSYTKTINATQTNPRITPGRFESNLGLFQFVVGPLKNLRSLMFLKYSRSADYRVETFLYAVCGHYPNGGVGGPGVGYPVMSEWGIAVRLGSEHKYVEDSSLAFYNEYLELAKLPPLANMTVVDNESCFM